RVWPEGSRRGTGIDAQTQLIGEGYMKTMGIRLLGGREFQRKDTLTSPNVAIVNQTLATRLALGRNPIGQRFRKEANPWSPEKTFEIIGLVSDTKYFSLKEEPLPIAYYATAQDSDPAPGVRYMIRSDRVNFDLAAVLRTTLKARYPTLGTDF